MRLATIRTGDDHPTHGGGTRAVLVAEDHVRLLEAPDVVSLIAAGDWRDARPGGETIAMEEVTFDAVVRPGKVICVGLNYRTHILEMGRELPTVPTLFAKFADVLTGPNDDIELPTSSDQVDWEAELGVVIGEPVRHAAAAQAREAIAGYTVGNDVSMRDWQWRGAKQWFAGKNFEATTPVGPVLVTPDEIDHASDLELRCRVDGEVMQQARTADLLFAPAEIIAYVSTIMTLHPGDLLLTGTPGGVAAGRDDEPFLQAGQVLETHLEGVGTCENRLVAESR